MTFWLDAHIAPQLAEWLGSQFKITVKSLREIGLHEAKDPVLIAAARRFGDIVIITKDGSFVEMVRQSGSPPRMIWLRCGNLTNIELQAWLTKRFGAAFSRLNAGEDIVEIPED